LTANLYDCMLLLDKTKYNANPSGVVDGIHALIAKHHGEIQASRPWDERKLSYPVKGHKHGTYFLIYFKMAGPELPKLEGDFNLNENILRFLVLKVPTKLTDSLLAMARDEHALALQSPGLADEPVDSGPKVPVPELVEG
jgi:small subunit ribosomal protein S6